MNFNKFINSDYLKSNPLCGINTYKDELNLATGACTRNIKKYEFTGNEDFYLAGQNGKTTILLIFYPSGIKNVGNIVSYNCVCSHYRIGSYYNPSENEGVQYTSVNLYFRIKQSSITDFITFLQQQYSAGTPVCIWYVLERPTTETITVPTGLSGTEEGYLNKSGTPTPTNPIYPTANTVEKWFDINHYIMGTSTDTITTPADINANDTTATVGLKGNTVQNGTPTPTTPIQPQECGERTGNLFDKNDIVINLYINSSGDIVYGSNGFVSNKIPVFENKNYCLQNLEQKFLNGYYVAFYDEQDNPLSVIDPRNQNSVIFTAAIGSKYFRYSGNRNITLTATTFTEGSTAPESYVPYGYKIPILIGSTIINKYLGEEQTTRQIKKIVLTGGETWTKFETGGRMSFYTNVADGTGEVGLSTHFKYGGSGFPNYDSFVYNGNTNKNMLFRMSDDTTITEASDFKQWLADQYAAGTPVTVWYVLAEPTTGIVNEPLRKIGDYADTVSNVSIPVTAGANTLSVDTTLQPSEVTVNYKGWHPVADVHKRESGAWT